MAATFPSGSEQPHPAVLAIASAPRHYPARSYLFHEGERSTNVLLIESGLMRIDRGTSTGRVVLLDLMMTGGLVGELGVVDDQPRSATASTVTACAIRSIGAEDFRQLLRERPDVQGELLLRITRRLRALSTQFVETNTMDASSRIAARLVRLVEIESALGHCVVTNGGAELRLPINQEELGQWAGLAREGAVKGLQTLRRINLISTGRMKVRINDLEELKKRAAPI